MRTFAVLLALILMGYGCRKEHVERSEPAELTARDKGIVVWLMKDADGLYYELRRARTDYVNLQCILHYALVDHPSRRLSLCLPRGLSVTNTFPIMEFAERYSITNIEIRLNQIPEPYDRRLPVDFCTDVQGMKSCF
jgi:hypothetical protein